MGLLRFGPIIAVASQGCQVDEVRTRLGSKYEACWARYDTDTPVVAIHFKGTQDGKPIPFS